MNKKIDTAVIPVAGLGTRMLPATKAIPKEMLPVVDIPLIQYIVEECYAAGIRNIIFVTHSSKNAIEDHFDLSFELETTLEKRVKRQILSEIQTIKPQDLTIMSVRQGHAKGLGHAILCAKNLVKNNPFAVVLPDVLINKYNCDLLKENLSEMVSLYNAKGIPQIMVEPVEYSEVEKYGIVGLNNNSNCIVNDLIEKPPVDKAPSNLSIVGRYILPAEILNILEHTPVGAGDEIQLTDAIKVLLTTHEIHAYKLIGNSFDCGDKAGYFAANIEYALKHPSLGNKFKNALQNSLKNS
ncbi:UTP--glucose-1-phosphate uridylyltransferase [Paraphotobacterium marinum]|uniref:UTP--glucose-1-phosphate uridylyltransferase n=1 Tax=Paraphotobacterium marinum TaxID=1755811 RepID=A0A220VBK4_9GAMM|nr:UTP--glucose-1-phosphate uridylyltransferase GalU [Paraphotobacterium marinum]ASK77735.1 UTP--glucose-1-phosphate uridylyltransferase [Paraphotobacterium marinum]